MAVDHNGPWNRAFNRKYTTEIQLRADPDVDGFEDMPKEQRELIRTLWNIKMNCEGLIDGLKTETETGKVNEKMRAYHLRAINDFTNALPDYTYDDLPDKGLVGISA